MVDRDMNRALVGLKCVLILPSLMKFRQLGIDLPFYHVRPLNDSQKLVTIYPFLLEIVEQELPCPPEIFVQMGIIASIRPRDIISELRSLISKMVSHLCVVDLFHVVLIPCLFRRNAVSSRSLSSTEMELVLGSGLPPLSKYVPVSRLL